MTISTECEAPGGSALPDRVQTRLLGKPEHWMAGSSGVTLEMTSGVPLSVQVPWSAKLIVPGSGAPPSLVMVMRHESPAAAAASGLQVFSILTWPSLAGGGGV